MDLHRGSGALSGGFGGAGRFGPFGFGHQHEHGHPGHPGHPRHEGSPEWSEGFGPEMARGPGGFPPPPPMPPTPPMPPSPGGPGGFGGPGFFGGGNPWGGGWPGAGGPGGWPGRGGGRGPARPVRPAVLALLAEEPMHGYQLMQEIRRRTNDQWRPSPGSVYPILQQLEDEGLVRTVETGGRRVAELTEAGRAHVTERAEELNALWDFAAPAEEGDDQRFPVLWRQIHELAGAAAQVGYSGTDAQFADVKRVLSEARRRVYEVLAAAEPDDED